jgi:hypothetical protein
MDEILLDHKHTYTLRIKYYLYVSGYECSDNAEFEVMCDKFRITGSWMLASWEYCISCTWILL